MIDCFVVTADSPELSFLNLALGVLFSIFSLDAYAAFLNSGIKRFSDVEHCSSDVIESIE